MIAYMQNHPYVNKILMFSTNFYYDFALGLLGGDLVAHPPESKLAYIDRIFSL
jgi:hypothetical protein